MIARALVVVALLVVGLTGSATSLPVGAAPAAAPGACTTAEGVTIIISFHELRNHETVVYCAPNSPSSGLDALSQAGVSWQATARFPAFVCRIQNLPVDDPCINPSPTNATWTYWIASRGGQWCYTNLGAGGRRPPAGTVEGWAFSLDRSAQAVARPALPPPPPLAGVAPPPISTSHCTGPSTPPAPPPQPGPTQPPPAAQPPAPRQTAPAPPAEGGGAQPANPGTGGTGTSDGRGDGRGGSNDPDGDSDPSDDDAEDAAADTDGDAGADDAEGDDADDEVEDPDGTGSTHEEEAALAEWEEQATDASGDGTSDDDGGGGSPWALIVAAVLVGGLGVGGYLRNRRTWTA